MGKKEFDAFVSSVTRQRIASICLALGWNSVHQSSMEIMQDLLVRYIRMLGMGAQARAELCNRTQSNVLDLQRLLEDMNISLEELGEYVEKVDDRALITEQIPSFPAPSKTDLNFLKPGSQEVLHRKSHIEQYLPPMYPELEKEEDDAAGITNITEGTTCGKTESGSENKVNGSGSPNILTPGGRTLTEKEAELNPFREMDSVMMTSSGFISPAREGRLPEALRPAVPVSSLATASLSNDVESGTPPATPTHPSSTHGTALSTKNATNTQRKRGPVPGSKHKRKKENISSQKMSNPVDSPDDLSDDETYQPPPGVIMEDISSSSKKLAVFQRKNKPRKQSPTKNIDTLNSSMESVSNYSEGHVDDIIQNVIERGIEESSKLPITLTDHQKNQNIASRTSLAPGQPSNSTRNEYLTSRNQSPKTNLASKQQILPGTGPKKRGRKKKSELLKMEAEKAALDASKSESSDVDICYDAPVRKRPKLTSESSKTAQHPIQLKVPPAQTLPPDASILLNNPLIPKVPYGFGDFSNFNVPTVNESAEQQGMLERPNSGARFLETFDSDRIKTFGNSDERKKKDKLGKKSKKDKKDKDKNKDRDKSKEKDKFKEKKDKEKGKEKNRDKKERNKELRREKKREEKERLREERRERKREEKEKDRKDKKKKKLMKNPNVGMPPLFAPAEQVLPVVQSQPSVPKIKIKDIKPDDKPKIIFKNIPGEQQYSGVPDSQTAHFKHFSADNHAEFNLQTKDKKQKGGKKKDKLEAPYSQEIEPLKIHKRIKQEKKERISSGETPKRKERSVPSFSHGPSSQDLIDIDPGASSSNSPQISSIQSPSSFVGSGSVTTQTVGKYVDRDGREIWICPGCGKQDDGSPMIGCDSCDDWYHWVCVNIHQEPADEDWFCPRCRARKSGSFLSTSDMPHGQQSSKRSLNLAGGRRGRPPKASK